MTTPNTGAKNSLLANLTPNQQRALLAELLRERTAKSQSAGSANTFAMSAGQQGLWYAFCRDPHATQFNVFLPTRIRSNLNLAALQKSTEFLTERHACLRTTFTDTGGSLRQHVHENLQPEFKVIDATQYVGNESQLQAMIIAESQRAFDLKAGPLLRLAVFRLGDSDHVVLATTHHIIVDFWSLILILAELRQLYPKFAVGQLPSLPLASNNYADFVAEQAAMLEGTSSERLRSYWTKRLRDAPTTLDIVTDYERPQAFTGRASIQSLTLPHELCTRVFQLAAAARTTPFTIVQAAIQVMLCQYTGQRDFLIGSPFSGRSHRKYESTVGFFVNMLPLRADLQGEPSFIEVIERVNQTLLEALEFEAYPFSAIVRDFNPPRDVSRSPLFQVSCTFEKAQLRSESGRAGFLFPGESAVASLGGLEQESFYVPHQTCHYDLEFIFEQTERNLRGMICYCRDLFSADSMETMAENYVQLLDVLLSSPQRSVFDCFVAPPRVMQSSANPLPATASDTVCDMIERAVAEHVDCAALRSSNVQLTYRQMMDQIRKLAAAYTQTLQLNGSVTPPIISVTARSSPDAVMGILGAMFSGAAAIPIDSEQPAVSLTDLQQDVSSLRPRADQITSKESSNDRLAPAPSDLAYIIYTSGSTGRPKGVMIEHQAICNTLRWRHSAVPLHAGDRVLMLLSHQFDAGLGIALATLTQGAELIWADPGARHDVHALVEQIIRDRITVLPAIPSLLRLVVEHPRFSECADLRMLWTGGEAMSRELPALVKKRTRASLWNLYGPTEAAVEAIATEIDSYDERCSVPLGKPISGVSVFVVDDSLRILPDTVPGQLAIAGRGLARGYLNRPELTAERFVQLNIGNGQSVRAYLTGDRGRRLRNGRFEFIGRTDYQVKLRGYRIELQEIEQHLVAHLLVAQAVVIVSDPDSSSAQLVGFICLRQPSVNSELVATQIRHEIAAKLPAYKVPVQLVVLGELPMTSSGKVDRKRLPRVTYASTLRTLLAPTTALEQHLEAAWCDSLKLENVSVDQNFFELGGSSLQAAMLTAKLTEDLGVHVPTSLLFDLADISQVAQRLVQLYEVQMAERFGMSSVTAYANRNEALSSAKGFVSSAVHALLAPLKSTGDKTPIFMVHPPGGIVMCYRELATRVDLQQPLYAIRSRGLHGHEALPQSIEEAARDYIAAMQSIQPVGPYRLGGWSLGGLFALEMATQLLNNGAEVKQLLLLDTALPDGAAHLVPSHELVSAGREYGLNLSLSELNALHPDEQLPLLWQHAKSLGVLHEETPPEVVTQVLNDLKSLFHHHMDLATRYQVRPYPGEITLVRPTEVPFEQAISPDRGWRFVANKVDVRYVSGHHHSMVQMPHVIELAAAIAIR